MYNLIKLIKESNIALSSALWIFKFIDDPSMEKNKHLWTKKNIFLRYLKSLFILFKNIYCYFIQKRKIIDGIDQCSILLYINSNNTINTLSFLKEVKEAAFFSQFNLIKKIHKSNEITHNFRIPIFLTLFSLINFLPFGLKYWRKIFKYPEYYFENWGKYYVNKTLLKANPNITKIVFANDHNIQNRLFLLAAKKLGIKTYYLQHASITSKFPPLEFDVNFLMGEVDKIKYLKIGNVSGYIHTVGSPKFDSLCKVRYINNKKNNAIGVSYNLLDDISKIDELLEAILRTTNCDIIVRPHPRDFRKINSNDCRIKILSPATQSLPDFLSSIDFLIAGESSIHLEAIYSNVKSYLYLFKNELNDPYEYVYNKLVELLTIKDILDKNYSFDVSSEYYKISAPFVGSINTQFDGVVSKFIIKEIMKDHKNNNKNDKS